MKQTKIEIKDVKKFVAPLRNLSKSVESIILSVKDDSIIINTRSEDTSQIANILYTNDVVSVEGNIEKFGIYNIVEFISVLTLSDANNIDLIVSGNTVTIHYGDKAKIEYILSSLELIKEGPADLKSKVEFLATFKVTPDFIKKVKSISNTIGATVLKFMGKNGNLSYSIVNKNAQSHSYTEQIGEEECDDFEVAISIRDDKRDNFGFLYENCDYNISIHPKIIRFEAITTEYGMLRYFLAPLSQ